VKQSPIAVEVLTRESVFVPVIWNVPEVIVKMASKVTTGPVKLELIGGSVKA